MSLNIPLIRHLPACHVTTDGQIMLPTNTQNGLSYVPFVEGLDGVEFISGQKAKRPVAHLQSAREVVSKQYEQAANPNTVEGIDSFEMVDGILRHLISIQFSEQDCNLIVSDGSTTVDMSASNNNAGSLRITQKREQGSLSVGQNLFDWNNQTFRVQSQVLSVNISAAALLGYLGEAENLDFTETILKLSARLLAENRELGMKRLEVQQSSFSWSPLTRRGDSLHFDRNSTIQPEQKITIRSPRSIDTQVNISLKANPKANNPNEQIKIMFEHQDGWGTRMQFGQSELDFLDYFGLSAPAQKRLIDMRHFLYETSIGFFNSRFVDALLALYGQDCLLVLTTIKEIEDKISTMGLAVLAQNRELLPFFSQLGHATQCLKSICKCMLYKAKQNGFEVDFDAELQKATMDLHCSHNLLDAFGHLHQIPMTEWLGKMLSDMKG